MHCSIRICTTHGNVMTHYDVTMDILSNIITYCDVMMGHGTKTTWSWQTVVLKTESPVEIWVWRFCSKQAIVQHINMIMQHIIEYGWDRYLNKSEIFDNKCIILYTDLSLYILWQIDLDVNWFTLTVMNTSHKKEFKNGFIVLQMELNDIQFLSTYIFYSWLSFTFMHL